MAKFSPEVAEIVEAMHELMQFAMMSERMERPWRRERRLARGITAQELMREQSPAEKIVGKARSIVARPLGWAVRQGVKPLGERLFQIGGTELMHEVLEEVAGRDEAHWEHIVDILDKRWDGIGGQWFA